MNLANVSELPGLMGIGVSILAAQAVSHLLKRRVPTVASSPQSRLVRGDRHLRRDHGGVHRQCDENGSDHLRVRDQGYACG
jgi:MOSC domain-containing protein YiiM